jgi:hypothetical protein
MSHPTRRISAVAGALDASQTWTQAATSWNSGTAPCTLPRHATVLTTPAPWYRVTTRARLGRPAGRITGPSAIYYIGRRDRRYRTHQQYLTWPEVRLTFYWFCGAHGASYSLKQLVLRFRRPKGPGRLTEPRSGGSPPGRRQGLSDPRPARDDPAGEENVLVPISSSPSAASRWVFSEDLGKSIQTARALTVTLADAPAGRL